MNEAKVQNRNVNGTKVRTTEFETVNGTTVKITSKRNDKGLDLSGRIGRINLSIEQERNYNGNHPFSIRIQGESAKSQKLKQGYKTLEDATKILSDYFSELLKTRKVTNLRQFEPH